MGYCKFIEVGIERQQESVTVDEAMRNYARSCECCAKRGLNFNYDCDVDCPITIAHREKLEAIRFLRQAEHEKKVREDELRRKLEECIKMMESIYALIHHPSQLDEMNNTLDNLTDEWLKMKGGENNA